MPFSKKLGREPVLRFLLNAMSLQQKWKHGEPPLPVLYFHRVLEKPDGYCPDDWSAKDFEQLVKVLNKYFQLINLSLAMELIGQNRLPANALCITFDDGYLDNYTIAKPILDKFNAKASFFVATEGTINGYLWSDEVKEMLTKSLQTKVKVNGFTFDISCDSAKFDSYLKLVTLLKFQPNSVRDKLLSNIREQIPTDTGFRCMMTDKQLQKLQDEGHDIGAHTHTHSILGFQSKDVAKYEIKHSFFILSNILKHPPSLFAYPNGMPGRDFRKEHQEMVLNVGMKYAFSTQDGGVHQGSPPTALPRFMPFRKSPRLFTLSVKKIAGELVS